jgi:pimeloyl-ACP methyl ester carboxylesterase
MKRLKKAAWLSALAFGVPAAVNLAISSRRKEPVNALPGAADAYDWPLAKIGYYVQGTGRPLLMVHGIGAGSSAFEWRQNFEELSREFRVFALDLPGFGRSDRRNLDYTADLYVLALFDFLRDVVKEPACVVASTLGAAFTIRLAAMRPELFDRLVLVCPTGLERLRVRTPVLGDAAYGVLSLPAIGESIYNGIASYSYIASYARQSLYVDPARVTPALVEHYYQYAHRPGGILAVRAFLSGKLVCDVTESYPKIDRPMLIAWGRQSKELPVEGAQAFTDLNPNARLRIFEESKMLPHDEEAEAFNNAVLAFLTEQNLSPQLPITDRRMLKTSV